jgi:hypothetical protein
LLPTTQKKKIISYFLNKELEKFKDFLLTQDTSNRVKLTKKRNIKNHSVLHDNITIAIHLSNSSDIGVKISEFNKSYLIRFNENYEDLNSYILDSIIKRKDFIELNCIEISNHKIRKDFNISCQTVELYVVSLFKVYSVIMNEILSMVYRNEI